MSLRKDKKLTKRYKDVCNPVQEKMNNLRDKLNTGHEDWKFIETYANSIKHEKLKILREYFIDCLQARENFYKESSFTIADPGHRHEMDILKIIINTLNNVISQRDFFDLGNKQKLTNKKEELEKDISDIKTYLNILLKDLQQESAFNDNFKDLVKKWFEIYKNKIDNNKAIDKDKKFFLYHYRLWDTTYEFDDEFFIRKKKYNEKELINKNLYIPYDQMLSQFFIYIYSYLNEISKKKEQINCKNLFEKYEKSKESFIQFYNRNEINPNTFTKFLEDNLDLIKNTYKNYNSFSFRELNDKIKYFNNLQIILQDYIDHGKDLSKYRNRYNNLCVILDDLIEESKNIYQLIPKQSTNEKILDSNIDKYPITGKTDLTFKNFIIELDIPTNYKIHINEINKAFPRIQNLLLFLNETLFTMKNNLIKDSITSLNKDGKEITFHNIGEKLYNIVGYNVANDYNWRELIRKVQKEAMIKIITSIPI